MKQKLRYDTVLLYLEGYPQKQISEILHIPRRTVSYHISRYENSGMESLVPGKHPGAPKKLSDAQESELLTVISTKTPQEAGVGVFANWTSALACIFVKKEFGVSFSHRGMQDLFARLGLRYTRPTYGKHEGVKPVGCLDYETGYIYVEEHKKYDAEVFLGFLKKIRSLYPGKKVVMILDNAKIHHVNLLKDFLEENRKYLEPVYLPPYSPNLNKVEELWGWLKDSVINNVFFHSREEIRSAVQKFITWVNTVPQMVIDRLCI